MPPSTPLRLILVEDTDSDEALLLTQLRRGGYSPSALRVETREAFAAALAGGPWELIIADYALPSFCGLEALKMATESDLDIPFILVSGTVGEELAVESMKAGAHDYVLKDNLTRLVPAVKRELRDAVERDARRRAERALIESIELFSRAFRASPDAMMIVETDTSRVVDVNDSNERLFGYPRDEVVGRIASELGSWQDPADFERLIGLIRKTGAVRDLEIPRKSRRNGAIITLNSAESLEFGGRRCAVIVVHDITQWRKDQKAKDDLQAQLRQSQKLEAIGTMAGGIAHDFNNILTAIMCSTEMVDSDLPKEHPSRPFLDQIQKASVQARNLINQILTFSRRQEQKFNPIHLGASVKDAVKMLESTLPSTLQINCSLPEEEPVIIADATQVMQVILNLATNASHAMEQTMGRLDLIVDAVAVDAEMARLHPQLLPGSFMRLQVNDSGCGMSPTVLEHIFEPFFTTKAEGKGTGLGLAVVHGIVKQHGGAIVVNSIVGKGTSFQVYFPVFRPEDCLRGGI